MIRLLRHDPGVRLGIDIEDVHQARVATRRLRSDLRTFQPLLDEAWADALRDELRWLGAELGRVRDAEVLRDRLRAAATTLPAPDRRSGGSGGGAAGRAGASGAPASPRGDRHRPTISR